MIFNGTGHHRRGMGAKETWLTAARCPGNCPWDDSISAMGEAEVRQ